MKVDVTIHYEQSFLTEEKYRTVKITPACILTTIDILRIVNNFVPHGGMELFTIKQGRIWQVVKPPMEAPYWRQWSANKPIIVDVFP